MTDSGLPDNLFPILSGAASRVIDEILHHEAAALRDAVPDDRLEALLVDLKQTLGLD